VFWFEFTVMARWFGMKVKPGFSGMTAYSPGGTFVKL
jgi:hypothetical protein